MSSFAYIIFGSLILGCASFDTPDTYRNNMESLNSQPLFDSSLTPGLKLGQPCIQSSQCQAAFSLCQSGVCSCRIGFRLHGDSCKAITSNCPFGRPQGSLIKCRLTLTRSDCRGPGCTFPPIPELVPPSQPGGPVRASFRKPSKWTDSCPSGMFCHIHNSSPSGSNREYRGHCCTRPQLQCPVGLPDDSYTCTPSQGQLVGGQIRRICPTDTHTCITVQLNGVGFPTGSQGICCPKPCTGDQVYANDRCYARANPNQKCQINEQCERSGSVCLNGRCSCPKGTIDKVTRCERPSCYTGFGVNRKVTPSLLDLSGNVKVCRQAIDCGMGAYCTLGSYCCEIPAAYCPNEPSKPLVNPRFCDPFGRTGTRCPRNLVCLQYYSSPEGGAGVCCTRKRIP